jgi:hypothetical protein
MAMRTNVGTVDRVIRLIVGVATLALAFGKLNVLEGSVWGIVAAVVGVAMLFTAAVGMCTLYIPLGISTCGVKKK